MKYNFTMSFKTYQPLNDDKSELMQHHFFIQNVESKYKDEIGYGQPDNVSITITNKPLPRINSKDETPISEDEPTQPSEEATLEVVMTKKDLDGVIECLTKVRNQL